MRIDICNKICAATFNEEFTFSRFSEIEICGYYGLRFRVCCKVEASDNFRAIKWHTIVGSQYETSKTKWTCE